MKSKIICIYKITCLDNNKIYIGQTRNFERRIREHKSKLKRNCNDNKYLQEDYNKYGLNSFSFEILEKCNEENLLEKETYWINYYGGKESKILYNMQDLEGFNYDYCQSRSGENNYMYRKTHSDKIKKRLHDINIGKTLSTEHKNKISLGVRKSNCHSIENNLKRSKASTKYTKEFIDILKIEYQETKSYAKLGRKYNIQPRLVSCLLRYGTTSSSIIKKFKNNS